MQTIGLDKRTFRKLNLHFSKNLIIKNLIRSAKIEGSSSIKTKYLPDSLVQELEGFGYQVNKLGESKSAKNQRFQISWE